MANYLTFSSPSSFTLGKSDNTKSWDGTLEYSTNATSWSVWDGTSAISSASDGTKHNLYLRGTGNTYITGSSGNYNRTLKITGANVSCSGNIENLLDYATVANGRHPTMAEKCFFYAFAYNSTLISTPSLPATTLANSCYYAMFSSCIRLATLPELPATTLADYCYQGMFSACPQIKLSAIQTGDYQTPYRIPTSGTGTTATNVFSNMFGNTGGTFTGNPTINTTYYTSNEVIPAIEPELEEPKITFNITENAEFTLATKGKYCDKDIAVNVAVPDERCFEVVGDTLVANCATVDGDTLVITPIEDKTLIL